MESALNVKVGVLYFQNYQVCAQVSKGEHVVISGVLAGHDHPGGLDGPAPGHLDAPGLGPPGRFHIFISNHFVELII